MRPGRIVMLVLGTLSALLGLGLLAAAGAAGFANYLQRDNGYFTTPSERYVTNSYALTTPRLDIMADEGVPDTAPVGVVGTVMLGGSAAAGKEIFIGIGPRSDVAAYLDGVSHSEIADVRFSPFRVDYRDVAGAQVPARPADQGFWAASASGAGEQQLEWDLRSGSWAVVIMNADGSAPVVVDMKAGARSNLLWPVFIGLLVGGIVFLLIGVPLIVVGAAGLGRGKSGPPHPGQPQAYPGQPQAYPGQLQPSSAASAPQLYMGGAVPGTVPGAGAGAVAGAPPGAGVVYPARLSGYLDSNLSRWKWLVKWLLAIPHFIVLFFLWFAFGVVTIVAWFAILFTGRYPRSLFNFNVGVIRWSWRVAFYSYGALGTDIYPPFTLERTDYPADFDVDYPEKLSRGLVLVKSWLLAIPHLLIIALLTGTAQTTWEYRDGDWVQVSAGLSLFGLLVLIAGLILLFTGVYSRGLFDFLMGLNRWTYRVAAYVSLMRDEYPPFHLDMGPRDPGDGPAIVPAVPAVPPAGPAEGQTGFYGIGGPPASGPEVPAGPDNTPRI
ncbi:DUF4389 domain-containing protein [Arthrobacter sp. UYEF36]|uniref:DUF4389 domain-containing protein n=1 Tax=Arthrobacter sp. UYEF36 TaxID=1756366 RepID=UPI0033933BC5